MTIVQQDYAELKATYDPRFIEKVGRDFPPHLSFVVQEKVHGIPAALYCDGSEACFVRRRQHTGIGAPLEITPELEKNLRRAMSLFERLHPIYSNIRQLVICGEIIGGSYPKSRTVPPSHHTYYAPHQEFYAFDLQISSGDRKRDLPVGTCNHLLESEHFFHARTLFQGSLEECLRYPNFFPSHIPDWLGLPPIKHNICAGVIIRPMIPQYTPSGERIILKNTNNKYTTYYNKTFTNTPHACESHNPDLDNLLEQLAQMVNEQKLREVVAQMGTVCFPRDTHRVTARFSKTVLTDFIQSNASRYDILELVEQHIFINELRVLVARLVKNTLPLIGSWRL